MTITTRFNVSLKIVVTLLARLDVDINLRLKRPMSGSGRKWAGDNDDEDND